MVPNSMTTFCTQERSSVRSSSSTRHPWKKGTPYVIIPKHRTNHRRFFFFLPLAKDALALVEGASWETVLTVTGVASCVGTGVPVDCESWVCSAIVPSEVCAINDAAECMPVVRIAFRRGSIFWCFLISAALLLFVDDVVPLLCCADSDRSASSSLLPELPSVTRFLARDSAVGESTMGHTKPVLGVKSGRWVRRMSNEDWSAWRLVNCKSAQYNQIWIVW